VPTVPGIYNPRTTIAATIGAGTTTIPVYGGSEFGTGVQCIQIDDEQILSERRVGDNFLGCVRGYNDTVAAAHAEDAPVTYRRTLEELVE
jgi:hypothetical protein